MELPILPNCTCWEPISSQKSAENAKHLLEAVDPDLMFVELCDERSDILHISTDAVKEPSFPWFSVVQEAFSSGMSVQHSLRLSGHGRCPALDCKTWFWSWRRLSTCVRIFAKKVTGIVCWFLEIDLNLLQWVEWLTSASWRATRRISRNCMEVSRRNQSLILKSSEARGDAVYNKAWEEQKTWTDFIMSGIVDNEDLHCVVDVQWR